MFFFIPKLYFNYPSPFAVSATHQSAFCTSLWRLEGPISVLHFPPPFRQITGKECRTVAGVRPVDSSKPRARRVCPPNSPHASTGRKSPSLGACARVRVCWAPTAAVALRPRAASSLFAASASRTCLCIVELGWFRIDHPEI